MVGSPKKPGIIRYLTDIYTGLRGLVLPRACILCGSALNKNEAEVCRLCLDDLPSTDFEQWADNPMFQKMEGRVELKGAFAGFYFRKAENLRKLIHEFKYKGNREVARELGRELGRRAVAAGFTEAYDYLIPVPLHEKKLKQRGYNQAECIAIGMGEVTGLQVKTDVLIRAIGAKSQTKQDRTERYNNVKDDFALASGAEGVEGRGLLLIDDVFTTGATAESCLGPLKEIDGVRIGVCTVGYVE